MNKILIIWALLVFNVHVINAQSSVKDKKARERASNIGLTTAAILGLSNKEKSDVNKSVTSLLSENDLIVLERKQIEKWQKIISQCASIISDLNMVFDIYENYDKSFEYMSQAISIMAETENWALLAEKEKLDNGFNLVFDEIDANLDLLLLILNQKVIGGSNATVHTKVKTRLLLIQEIHNSSEETLKRAKTCQLICKQLDASAYNSITLEKLIN